MEISSAFPMKHFAYQYLFSGESVLVGWTKNKKQKTKIEKKGKGNKVNQWKELKRKDREIIEKGKNKQ